MLDIILGEMRPSFRNTNGRINLLNAAMDVDGSTNVEIMNVNHVKYNTCTLSCCGSHVRYGQYRLPNVYYSSPTPVGVSRND